MTDRHGDEGGPSPIWADALTLARFPLGLLIVLLISADRAVDAGMVLVLGWVSDAADGRLARRSPEATRFGHLDLHADASLGLAVIVGLMFTGDLPRFATLAGTIVIVGLTWFIRNPAPILLLMGGAYARFLWVLTDETDPLRWVALAAPAVLLIVEGRRLFGVVIPAFLRAGMAALGGRRPDRALSLDEWREDR